MKKIAFFSTGVPDDTQGGSGIFNYNIINELINRKYSIDVFLRSDKYFFEKYKVNVNLEYYRSNTNSFNIIEQKTSTKNLNFFYSHLKDVYWVDGCIQIVKNLNVEYDAFISMDLGWAIALSEKKNVISFLGDPYCDRVNNSLKIGFNFLNIFRKYRAISTGVKMVNKKLGNILNSEDRTVCSFSKYHAEKFNSENFNCIQVNGFSNYISDEKIKKNFLNKETFVIAHLGDLNTTASRKNLDFLNKSIDLMSINLKKKIILKFIGRYSEKKIFSKKNVEVIYSGFVQDINTELIKCDAVVSAADYPVGIRQRIISSLSLGMPCIAHNSVSYGLHQLIHGYDILYCQNPNEFVNCINLLIQDLNLQKKLSINARNTWLKNFNPKFNIDYILKKINC
tara:strand:+ start:291 stop:1475 length:1185 start_codon:yes stop_codon:yes gene_type:complete